MCVNCNSYYDVYNWQIITEEVCNMNNLVSIENGKSKTTSKIVSSVFNKSHRDVIRAINQLDCSDEFRARNFAQSSYTSPQNKILKCFDMTRDGFTFLCMGFTGSAASKWKEAYINAFNEMERGLLNVDSRINALSIQGEQIKESGKQWSELGREIRRQKVSHQAKVTELIDQVQLKINLE